MAEHLREPLDYLYEELPPEKMAEVRKHLAACPTCRADMRAVRETVKLYRQTEKPTVPSSLADRTARAALREAGRHGTTAATSAPGMVSAVASAPAPALSTETTADAAVSDLDREFAKLKEEVLREIPRGWRTWLFHPAWTVAASVIFVCAVLIHVSPRANQLETRFLPTVPATREDGATRQIRERERLPSSHPRENADPVPAAEPAPILQEAAALNEAIDLPSPATVSGETGGTAATQGLSAPVPQALQPGRFAAKVLLPERETESGAGARGRASRAVQAPEREMADEVFASPVRPPNLDGDDRADPAETVRDQSAPPNAAGGRREPDDEALPPLAPPRIASRAADIPRDSSETPVEVLESLGEKTKSLAREESQPVVILDMLDPDTVPQLIERPPGYDPAERIQSLTTLAGMQMASGEFADAWRTVGLLEKYDADAARILGETLRSMEQSAQREEAETPPVEEDPAADEQENAPATSAPSEDSEDARIEFVPEIGAANSPPIPEYARYLEMVEPPEDPPMSLVIVPRGQIPPARESLPALTPAPEDSADAMVVVSVPATAPVREPVLSSARGESVRVGTPVALATSANAASPDFPDAVGVRRPVVKESAYVDTPVVRETEEGEYVTLPQTAQPQIGEARSPAAVHVSAPIVVTPMVIATPPHTEQRQAAPRRRRSFTTDPYFRDY